MRFNIPWNRSRDKSCRYSNRLVAVVVVVVIVVFNRCTLRQTDMFLLKRLLRIVQNKQTGYRVCTSRYSAYLLTDNADVDCINMENGVSTDIELVFNGKIKTN